MENQTPLNKYIDVLKRLAKQADNIVLKKLLCDIVSAGLGLLEEEKSAIKTAYLQGMIDCLDGVKYSDSKDISEDYYNKIYPKTK